MFKYVVDVGFLKYVLLTTVQYGKHVSKHAYRGNCCCGGQLEFSHSYTVRVLCYFFPRHVRCDAKESCGVGSNVLASAVHFIHGNSGAS